MTGLGDRLLNAMSARLPGKMAALVDEVRRDLPGTYGPMNGQIGRMGIIRGLFSEFDFEQVLETGTYRAATTQFLSALTSAPVTSAEVMARFYEFSRKRTLHIPNVTLHFGDSREMLSRQAQKFPTARTFLYLDAHWEADVPRRSELEIVRDTWTSSVVVIDDFTVPGDAGYGAANYAGRILDETYLPTLPGWVLAYPSIPSASETGARRGSAFLFSPEFAKRCGNVAGLTDGRVLG